MRLKINVRKMVYLILFVLISIPSLDKGSFLGKMWPCLLIGRLP